MEFMMNDLISRQAAIDAVRQYCIDHHIENGIYHANGIEYELTNLPSAQSEQKKGKWIYKKINEYSSRTYCSECDGSAPFIYIVDNYYGNIAHGETVKTNFCPNCGADMRGDEE